MAQTGFLLIADITGYTMFLTRSELDHAQGILDALFKSIFAEIKAPIILSNLQGDAALTHLPDVNLPQRQFPLDAIERIYCSFSDALAAMRVNTNCTCNACRNMGQLDLKFFLHHGPYATQQMAGRTELQGAEVIRLHRLMKNSVTAETGIKAYALVTEQAAEAIGLPDFFAAANRLVETTGDFGDTVCYAYDLAPIYARWRASRRIVVQADEPLAFESLECDLPVPPPVAWAYVDRRRKEDPLAARPRQHDHERIGPRADRAGIDAALRPWQGFNGARHRRLAAVRLRHLAHQVADGRHRAANGRTDAARKWRHASVVALCAARGAQPGCNGAGADHHAARDGEEAGCRSARLEGRAGAAGSGGERGARGSG